MSQQKKITAGLELETVKLSNCNRIIEQHNFGRRYDSSILGRNGIKLPKSGPEAPVELVTPVIEIPVVVGSDCIEDVDLRPIAQVSTALLSCAGEINSTCGIHIHLGRPNGELTDWNPRRLSGLTGGPASEWKPGHVRTALLIGLLLEDRLFSVMPTSRSYSRHCKRIRDVYSNDEITSYCPTGQLLPRKQDNKKRYAWLNLIETRRPQDPEENRIGYARSKAFGTIEIRMLGETVDPTYTFTWITMWIKIASAIAYLPGESAALHCAFSSWLQPEFDELKRCKERHEANLIPHCRLTREEMNSGNATALEDF